MVLYGEAAMEVGRVFFAVHLGTLMECVIFRRQVDGECEKVLSVAVIAMRSNSLVLSAFMSIRELQCVDEFAQTSHHSLSHISILLEIHDIPHHFAHSA